MRRLRLARSARSEMAARVFCVYVGGGSVFVWWGGACTCLQVTGGGWCGLLLLPILPILLFRLFSNSCSSCVPLLILPPGSAISCCSAFDI